MGKVRQMHRRKKYNYDTNRRKQWQKSKKMPTVKCKPMKNAWNEKRSVEQNMRDMGLSIDPNKTMPIRNTKDLMGSKMPKKSKTSADTKTDVINDMEEEANQPQQRLLKFSDPVARYCIYMMEKYGEDYKAMARDEKNYYQETPKQIKRKINTFKNLPGQSKTCLQSDKDTSS